MIVRTAETPADFDTVRELLLEYATELKVDLCFQGFDEELRTLPGDYAPPRGLLLLAQAEGMAAGCVAVRPFGPVENNWCEMKRLFVRPPFRMTGLGRILVNQLILSSKALGYDRMVLDTLQRLPAALSLYRSTGFVSIEAYYRNHLEGVVYLKRDL